MYVDSAYWHNSRINFKDKKHPLTLLLEKVIFTLMGKKKLYLLGTSLSIVRKKNNVITIMVSITRKFTGYTLPGIM